MRENNPNKSVTEEKSYFFPIRSYQKISQPF